MHTAVYSVYFYLPLSSSFSTFFWFVIFNLSHFIVLKLQNLMHYLRVVLIKIINITSVTAQCTSITQHFGISVHIQR